MDWRLCEHNNRIVILLISLSVNRAQYVQFARSVVVNSCVELVVLVEIVFRQCHLNCLTWSVEATVHQESTQPSHRLALQRLPTLVVLLWWFFVNFQTINSPTILDFSQGFARTISVRA